MGGETAEVPDIEGHQAPFAVCQHGGDDVGIMDLFTTYGNIAAETCQRTHDMRPVLQNLERFLHPGKVGKRPRHRQRCGPRLRPGRYREIFAHYLAADAQNLTGPPGPTQRRPRCGVGRGCVEPGGDEKIGIDEHAVQPSDPEPSSRPPVNRAIPS